MHETLFRTNIISNSARSALGKNPDIISNNYYFEQQAKHANRIRNIISIFEIIFSFNKKLFPSGNKNLKLRGNIDFISN